MNMPTSISLLSLLAGRRKYLLDWGKWLLEAEYPVPMDIVVLDNSGDPEFSGLVRDFFDSLWERPEVRSLSFRSEGARYSPKKGEGYFELGRHTHVANLYQEIIPTQRGEILFTLEDDVIPPKDAIPKMLREVWSPNSNVGAVAGAYSMPTSKSHITAATEGSRWSRGIILWSDLPEGPMKVGFTGGGCTMWNLEAVGKSLPIRAYLDEDEGIRGWDNNLSRSIVERGYDIYVHGAVRCKHLTVDDMPSREDGW